MWEELFESRGALEHGRSRCRLGKKNCHSAGRKLLEKIELPDDELVFVVEGKSVNEADR